MNKHPRIINKTENRDDQGRIILWSGPWGIKYCTKEGPLHHAINPLHFLCAFCNTDSINADPAHIRGCKHPFAYCGMPLESTGR